MTEISFISAARAAILRNDTRNLRQQELRNTQRLQQLRQEDVDKQARVIQDQLSLDRRRLDTLRQDLSQESANRRFFRAQEQTRDIQANDRQVQDLRSDIRDENLRARGLDVERSLPPLTPSQPIGGLITPEELEIQRQLAEPDRPPPLGLPPLEDRPPPLTPFEAPAPGVAAIDDFEPAPAADQTEALTFALQERERTLRVNERHADEFDSQVRQEIDLQLAQDRIDEGNFDPERPRGAIVDVFG
ncbi:MAG: hypothetical protein IH994_10380 [Proteobacteria bacterium]|nr:hypothetical protein [Pseudomonadota bacterium]